MVKERAREGRRGQGICERREREKRERERERERNGEKER